MSDSKRLRLAVVGCGAVAERYHLPAIAASPFVELVAVCDAARDRALAVARRFGGPVVLERHEELPGRVDAALVAVPNQLHAPVACDLLRAGVHVLVEKPMARTSHECDQMLAAAEEGGAVLAVGHDFRFFPVARFAKGLFESGFLGEVERVDLRQSATGRWPYASPTIYSREAAGGGVLLDFGVHVLDLLMWWLGDAEPRWYRDDASGGVEAECELELQLASGATAFVVMSRARALRDTFVVRCANGTAEIGVFEPAVVRLTLDASAPLVGDVVDHEFANAPLVTLFGRQLAAFARAIAGGEAPLVSGEEGRRAVALVESCYALREPLRRSWDYPEAYSAIGRDVS